MRRIRKRKLFLRSLPILVCMFIFTGFMYLKNEKPTWVGGDDAPLDFRISPNFADQEAGDKNDQIAAILKGADTWYNEGLANFQFEYKGPRPNIAENRRFQFASDMTSAESWRQSGNIHFKREKGQIDL